MLLERGEARNFLSIVRGRCVMLLEEGQIVGVKWDPSTPLRVPEYQYKGADVAVKFLARAIIHGSDLHNILQAGREGNHLGKVPLPIDQSKHKIVNEGLEVVGVLGIAIPFPGAVPDTLGLEEEEKRFLELGVLCLLIFLQDR